MTLATLVGLKQAEAEGFVVVDVEELRRHYEETLRFSFRALTMHRHELARLADRRSLRGLELYIAYSAESLRAGHTSYNQREVSEPAIEQSAKNIGNKTATLYPLAHQLVQPLQLAQ